ncbi:MAG: PqqD family protein [Nitrospiraceae bacterium]|nr:MAG: PqqD family protein [Nitrospiraceae bacterium]
MDTIGKDISGNYEKNPSVVCTGLDDGGILLDLDTKYYFVLNETGLRIWQLMDECRTSAQIVHNLVNEYEVDEGKASGSVQALMQELERNGLIKS